MAMYYGEHAPWEQYPKNLEWNEIKNPLKAVEGFFNSGELTEQRSDLKQWRNCVITENVFPSDRHGPGTVLFICKLNLQLIEAMHLLLLDYNTTYINKPKYTAEDVVCEKEQWDDYPRNLSAKEEINPYRVCKKAFKDFAPQQYRNYLDEWQSAALSTSPIDESMLPYEVIAVYDNLKRLYSAAWIILQRDEDRKAKLSEKKAVQTESQSAEEIKEKNIHPVIPEIEGPIDEQPEPQVNSKIPERPALFNNFKNLFHPEPTPAERLGLIEIKNLILKKVPAVQLIVQIGTHQDPFTYYLLLLISEEEKTPEGELSNKIEDICKPLTNVYAIVHKTESAIQGIKQGSRFWNRVIAKGNIIHQSPDIALPEPKQISNEVLIERADFNWHRWGEQGKEFLKGADVFLQNSNYRLAAFMLHQATESILKGIIQSILGYRVQVHNLSRLIRLSLLITDEFRRQFMLHTIEGAQTFALLKDAYSHSRYDAGFEPDGAMVKALNDTLGEFYSLAKIIQRHYIEFLKEVPNE